MNELNYMTVTDDTNKIKRHYTSKFQRILLQRND